MIGAVWREAWILIAYVFAMAFAFIAVAIMVFLCHFFWINGMGRIGIFFGFTTFGGAPLSIHVYNYAIWMLPAVPIVWLTLGFALWKPVSFFRVFLCYLGVVFLVWFFGRLAVRGVLELDFAMNLGMGTVFVGGYFASRFFIFSPLLPRKILVERRV